MLVSKDNNNNANNNTNNNKYKYTKNNVCVVEIQKKNYFTLLFYQKTLVFS